MALCGIGGFDIINKELILIDKKNIIKSIATNLAKEEAQPL